MLHLGTRVAVWVLTIALLIGCDRKGDERPVSTARSANTAVSEPWRSIIQETRTAQSADRRTQILAQTEREYQELQKQRVVAEREGNLEQLHKIGTRFNVLAAMGGRVEAYGDAVVTFQGILGQNASYPPAKWGLAFVYYNLAINDLMARVRQVRLPSGLYVFPLDERGADLMIQVYRLADDAVKGGYGPSDPDVLEMSGIKLMSYCRKSEGSNTSLCSELRRRYSGGREERTADSQGTETSSTGVKYVGEYRDGRPNGVGTITWPDGSAYRGMVKDAVPHGQGVYSWPNGATFSGRYENGRPNGHGTETHPDGWKYVGEYKNGLPNGKGTKTLPDGTTYSGRWKDDDFLGL